MQIELRQVQYLCNVSSFGCSWFVSTMRIVASPVTLAHVSDPLLTAEALSYKVIHPTYFSSVFAIYDMQIFMLPISIFVVYILFHWQSYWRSYCQLEHRQIVVLITIFQEILEVGHFTWKKAKKVQLYHIVLNHQSIVFGTVLVKTPHHRIQFHLKLHEEKWTMVSKLLL